MRTLACLARMACKQPQRHLAWARDAAAAPPRPWVHAGDEPWDKKFSAAGFACQQAAQHGPGSATLNGRPAMEYKRIRATLASAQALTLDEARKLLAGLRAQAVPQRFVGQAWRVLGRDAALVPFAPGPAYYKSSGVAPLCLLGVAAPPDALPCQDGAWDPALQLKVVGQAVPCRPALAGLAWRGRGH